MSAQQADAGKVKVIGINFIRAIYTDIRKRHGGLGVDFTPIEAKLAVDMAVAAGEANSAGKVRRSHAGIITKRNIASFVWDTMSPTKDYKVTYTVDAK